MELKSLVTKCSGNGQGSCKRCSDNGIWNRMWLSFLYKIEGYPGCYCSECVKFILSDFNNVYPADKHDK